MEKVKVDQADSTEAEFGTPAVLFPQHPVLILIVLTASSVIPCL